ncbi:hypothetical protein AB7441_23295, partial [Providencia rettgeri]
PGSFTPQCGHCFALSDTSFLHSLQFTKAISPSLINIECPSSFRVVDAKWTLDKTKGLRFHATP